MRHLLSAGVAVTLVLAACGGAATAPSTTTATGAAAPAASSSASSTTKASANNATAAQLQAAFEAAGVPNASRWVVEVQEYRPYPTDDPSFAKLRSNLAKYNPSADTLSRILAALSLP
jgi:hypothetical protein